MPRRDTDTAPIAVPACLSTVSSSGGDVMNFDMAAELPADRGMTSETVLVTDDVSSAPPAERSGGGVSRATSSSSRLPVREPMRARRWPTWRRPPGSPTTARARWACASACTVPTAGVPTFELPDGEMDIGMGVHGESGLRRAPTAPADEVADELLDLILADGATETGDPVLVVVNTLGATPVMEAFIVLRRVAERLRAMGSSCTGPSWAST